MRGVTTRPMRVLLTADAVGGIWTYALDLCRGLSNAGIAVTLVVLGPAPNHAQIQGASAIEGLNLVITGLPLDWNMTVGPAALRSAGFAVAALAQMAKADLVHLNSPALAAFTDFPAPVIGGCHSCLATWWRAVRGRGPLPANFAWRRDLLHEGYRRCRTLIAPSRSFAEATRRCYGLSQAPNVVHNGRVLEANPTSTDLHRMVFTAGRLWDEGKNLAALARASAFVGAPIYAAGSPQAPDGAVMRLNGLCLLGQTNAAEVARHLARRPVFVSTARYEPFGLAVLEAAQAGCALVLSDIPSFRELWDGAATFVPAEDERQVAKALNALLDDPSARVQAGASAIARARRYSVEEMVDGTLAVYDKALNKPSPDVQAVA